MRRSPIIKMLAKDPTDSYESALERFLSQRFARANLRLFRMPVLRSCACSSIRSAIILGALDAISSTRSWVLEVNDEILQVVTLTKEDVIGALKYLIRLKQGDEDASVDDIDHLGNRRVRSVGELIQNQCRIGLARMEKIIRERMNLFDFSSDTLTPGKIVSAKGLVRRSKRLLRQFSAFAVYGSNQPDCRTDPQTTSFLSWTWRLEPRSSRI